jgi:Holliday junction resolvase RusA-like endonuclease
MGRRNYPDGDKLERNIWDALTGIVFADDVQVVDHHATKEWGPDEGALITIASLN